jgi:hypothetical protein
MAERLLHDTLILLGTYLGTKFRDSYVAEAGELPSEDLAVTGLELVWADVRRLLEIKNEDDLFKLFSTAYDAAIFGETPPEQLS